MTRLRGLEGLANALGNPSCHRGDCGKAMHPGKEYPMLRLRLLVIAATAAARFVIFSDRESHALYSGTNDESPDSQRITSQASPFPALAVKGKPAFASATEGAVRALGALASRSLASIDRSHRDVKEPGNPMAEDYWSLPHGQAHKTPRALFGKS